MPGTVWNVLFVAVVCVGWLGCDRSVVARSETVVASRIDHGGDKLHRRAIATLPVDESGTLIRLGYEVVTQTQVRARSHVGNALNCSNCHLDAGRRVGAAPFIGLAHVYPEYRARNAKVNSLEDRLNDCFVRSMNGRALHPGSREQRALVAYITWLSEGITREDAFASRGFARIVMTRPPQPDQGERVYLRRCSGCHGNDGHGTSMAPPLWGPGSYNLGAGMARISVAASFIKHNMPLGQVERLTDEEAYDVASYVNRQPRPDFPAKLSDWPRGGRPADAPY